VENRTFIPGSEWVYFKLYTGTKTADAILKNELFSYVNEMLNNNIIDKWFFIRYNDPDFHVRLRLHQKETMNFSFVFNSFFDFFSPAVSTGIVWDIQCGTYQREMERYGANTISMVENFFFIDSEFIIKLLHQLREDNPEQHRWKLAIILIDSFLSAFSFDTRQKQELLSMMTENYKKEFGFTQINAKKQLDNKYRTNRREIEQSMMWETDAGEVMNVIKARRETIFAISEKMLFLEKHNELQVTLNSLLTSMIHMTMNRWFRTKNRLHELVIYDFMFRYYTSEIAKKKYIK
jgi:thiopeptide-type bacteriocin biosynthesis protein